ncbi:MAG: NUDIX hydrolase [Pseudomonadota bacterium]
MSRRIIYAGQVVDLGIEPVQIPDGPAFDLEVVRHPGGAGVVALNEQQEVCLERQYRHAAGGWIWEIPAGKIDTGEPPLQTAKRELQEETGVTAEDWVSLGEMFSTPGFCDEKIYIYLARDLSLGQRQPEMYEHIEVHWIPLPKALEWVYDNTIQDAKTITGLTRAAWQLQS